MNILLISQCTKRALTETRRILDQFAERRGDCVWQTPITRQGLDTLRRLLRRTARRNTAVACYWIRGRNRTELLWIVGNAACFNEEGAVPTNRTRRNILRKDDENDWHTANQIKIMVALAALFHDFGKACDAFQKRLEEKGPPKNANIYRHEWLSLQLFATFVLDAAQGSASDSEWLTRLGTVDSKMTKRCLARLKERDIQRAVFHTLPPLAQAIGWLICSHHRLPESPTPDEEKAERLSFERVAGKLDAGWNSLNSKDATERAIKPYRTFSNGLLFDSTHWCRLAHKWAGLALQDSSFLSRAPSLSDDLYSLHLARLALMVGDHCYSGQPVHAGYGDDGYPLYANTDKEGQLKQRLDEHSCGVLRYAGDIMRTLPRLADLLPRLARHKGFQRRSDKAYRWQDLAYELAASVRETSERQGFFGVNMASTGCGKTFANGRIMYALANPHKGARFSIAIGLRTLTLQTGAAYRQRLGLTDEDLAVVIGSSEVQALFEQQQAAKEDMPEHSSASAQPLMEDTYVHYEGALQEGTVKKWFDNTPAAQKILSAPILTCTIDHLIGATEGVRGGKQIVPMLRLMTSDLVLDEPDDFDVADLPALTRLVHWAGLLGSRVLLSSATLPPSLIEGLFAAYRAGRESWQRSRGEPGAALDICCLWVDEFGCQAQSQPDVQSFVRTHQAFVKQRLVHLARENAMTHRAAIRTIGDVPDIDPAGRVAATLPMLMWELHQAHHSVDPVTQKRASFGLVRIANIDNLIDVAQALYAQTMPDNCHVYLCCYHSRHPLFIRSQIEQRLDKVLNRHQENAVFNDENIHQLLAKTLQDNMLFVVLASPVAEVGRDHDYDWAIVEPSSMRSIIQLAGRVQRHRKKMVIEPNIYLLETNIKHLRSPGSPAYQRPGFETGDYRLASHQLADLLLPEQYRAISAAPRIVEPDPQLIPWNSNLASLEHHVLRNLMCPNTVNEVTGWWQTAAHQLGVLQRQTQFRKSEPEERFYLGVDDDNNPCFFDGISYASQNDRFEWIGVAKNPAISSWGDMPYAEQLACAAEVMRLDMESYARRFAWVDLPKDNEKGWCYNLLLGFQRKR